MPKERFDDSPFSRGLATFMNRRNLTLDKVGNLLNCTRANVWNLRTGKTAPSYWILARLLDEGMTLEEVFGDRLASKVRKEQSEPERQLPSDPVGKAMLVREGLKELLAQLEEVEKGSFQG